MCRNIRVLHNFEPAATPEEVEAAALQYVRKISGATKPSKANEAAFARAVEEVTATSRRLLDSLVTHAPPRDRDVEAAVTSSTARANAASFAFEGLFVPLILRTYWSAAASTSSGVAVGSKLCSTLMFLHMPQA